MLQNGGLQSRDGRVQLCTFVNFRWLRFSFGARIGPDMLARAAAAGIDPSAALAANDSYGIFAALDDLVVTGPTHTNVNDFRAILIEP